MSDGSRNPNHLVLLLLQGAFYVTVSVATIYGLYINYKQTKLIYKPVIGVTHAEVIKKYHGREEIDENLAHIEVIFDLENVGNLPAKKLCIDTKAKVAEAILEHEKIPHLKMGAVFLPKAKAWNKLKIPRNKINEMIKGNRCFYMIEFSYCDWEEYDKYSYKSCFEIFILETNPLKFAVQPVSCELMETGS